MTHFIKVSLIFLGFFFFISYAQAATYYTAITGSDGNSCANARNVSTPKRTIAAGVDCLTAGDTLLIGNGTYSELIRDIPNGTSWASPVTIKAQNARQAGMRPPASGCGAEGNSGLIAFDGDGGDDAYIIIEGLVLDGNNQCGPLKFRPPGGSPTGNISHHIRILNNEIKNAPGSDGGTGIIAGGAYTNNIEIINNDIHDITNSHYNHCVYFHTQGGFIEGNRIYNCAGSGITLHESKSGPRAQGMIIRNNFINNVVGPCIRLSGRDNTAYNNICSNAAKGDGEPDAQVAGRINHYAPLMANLNSATNNAFYNNTVYAGKGSSRGCIYSDSDSSGSRIKNNICWGGVNDRIVDQGLSSDISNNLCSGSGCSVNSDPKFTNASQGDFRLQSGSPVIDRGVTASIANRDIRGVSRPKEIAYDIGAFEGVGGSQPSIGSGSGGALSNFCHLLDSSRSVPEGFGAAYNVLTSAKEVLLKAICGESTVGYPVGNGSSLQYIFNQGYYWTGSNWQTFSYTCQGQTVGSWCVGNADFTRQLSTTQLQTTNYYVAYICNWTGSSWKCGCSDSTCATPKWNLQAFKK